MAFPAKTLSGHITGIHGPLRHSGDRQPAGRRRRGHNGPKKSQARGRGRAPLRSRRGCTHWGTIPSKARGTRQGAARRTHLPCCAAARQAARDFPQLLHAADGVITKQVRSAAGITSATRWRCRGSRAFPRCPPGEASAPARPALEVHADHIVMPRLAPVTTPELDFDHLRIKDSDSISSIRRRRRVRSMGRRDRLRVRVDLLNLAAR